MAKQKSLKHSVVMMLLFVMSLGLVDLVAAGGGMEYEPDEDAEVSESGFASSGKLSYTTPDLDDEDQHSMHMPDQLLCDACRILAQMFQDKFDKLNAKRPSLKKNLPESEVLDGFEEVCADDFNSVGIKEIKGVKRLSGPGLAIKDVPGIMQGGGKWPRRMQQLCNQYVGDFEEDTIYDTYKKNTMKEFLCFKEGRHCAKVEKKQPKKDNKKQKKNTKKADNKEEL